MHPCPYCPRDDIKSAQGLTGHIRMVHGTSQQVPLNIFGLPDERARDRNPPGRAAGRPAETPLQSPPWYESTDKMDEMARNAALAAPLKLDENPRVQSYLAKIGFNVEKAIRAAFQVVADQLNKNNGGFAAARDTPTMEAFINDLEKRFQVAYESTAAEQIEQLATSQEIAAVVTEAQCRQIVHSEFMELAQMLVANAQDQADKRHPPGPCEKPRCTEGCNARILKAKGEVMALIKHRLPDTFKDLKMIETAMRSGDPLMLPMPGLHLIDEVAKRRA